MKLRTKVLVGLSVFLLASGSTVAYAAIPDSDDAEIHGCYAPAGQLRVIDNEASAVCVPGETELTWNQTGPPGPLLPTYVKPLVANNQGPTVELQCNSGDKLLSASSMRNDSPESATEVRVIQGYVLNGANEPVGVVFEGTGGAVTITYRVVCMDAP